MISKNRKHGHKITTVLFIVLSLVIIQTAIAATGTINFNTVYQQLEGFGGSGVYDAWQLKNHGQAEEIYDLLFEELGIDIYRIQNTYGHIEDYDYITHTGTIVSEAKTRTPNLKILLVPWSPPEYLKSNNNLIGGTLAVDTNDANYAPYFYAYNGYADWWYESLIDDVNGWAGAGITPDYISLQNEPDLETGYSSCKFLPTETASYAGYDLAFEAVHNKLNAEMGEDMPKIIGPETTGINTGSTSLAGLYLNAINNLGIIDNLYGFSFHIYSDGLGDYTQPDDAARIAAYQNFKTDYGDEYGKPLFQTEYVAEGTPEFSHAPLLAQHIHNCLVYGNTASYLHWTLFRSYGTGGMINLTTPYQIRDIYYWFKHYSYFTDPGWHRVGATTADTNLRITAFKNPAGDEMTIVVVNISGAAISLTLTINGFEYDLSEVYRSSATQQWVDIGEYSPAMSLPARSITTIHLVSNLERKTLTVSSTSGGSVTTPGEGSFQYVEGSNPYIIATPAPYYHFVEWTGSAVDAGKVWDADAANTRVLMDANYAVVANFALNNFGYNSTTGRYDKVIINDCLNVPVTFTLTKAGYGEIVGECDFTEIILNDTTINSIFTMKSLGTTVGDITVLGDINKIAAKTTDLEGNISIDGAVKSLEMDDTLGGNTINIGETVDPRILTAIRFDQIQDLNLVSLTPIKSLIATEWIDNEDPVDEVSAPSIAKLQIKGDRRRVLAGNFDADLYLTGAAVEPTLKNGKIIGSLRNSIIVDGDVGTLAINYLRGDLQINGSARTIKTLDPLALIADANPLFGQIEITKTARSIKGYKDSIKCLIYDDSYVGNGCTFYSRSSPYLYSPEELSLYNTPMGSWTYPSQYTATESGVTTTGTEEIYTTVQNVDGGCYEITTSAAGVDMTFGWCKDGDATNIIKWIIEVGDDVFDVNLVNTAVTPESLRTKNTYKSYGTYTGTFSNDSESLEGDMQGTTTATTRLMGHEQIVTEHGIYMTAKIRQTLKLKGTISNIEYCGLLYTFKFYAYLDQISWSDADTGYVKYQIRNLQIIYALPGAGTQKIKIKEIGEILPN